MIPRQPELLVVDTGGADAFLQTRAWPYIGSKAFFGYLIESGPCNTHPALRRALTLRIKASLLGASSIVYSLMGRVLDFILNLRCYRDPLQGLVRTLVILHLQDIRYLNRPEVSNPPL